MELRILRKTISSVIGADLITQEVDILQFRTSNTVASNNGGVVVWSEWQDVPVVEE